MNQLLLNELKNKLGLEVIKTSKIMTKKEILIKMYQDNELEKEDVYKHQHYLIITRSGIEKIQAKNKINISFNLEHIEKELSVIKAIAIKEDEQIETYGSASKETSHNKYYTEMAEKRSLSRAVLKIMGLYQHGVYGEDESDDFKRNK